MTLNREDKVALLRILPIQLIDIEVKLLGNPCDIVKLMSSEVITVVVKLGLDLTTHRSKVGRVRIRLVRSHIKMQCAVRSYLGGSARIRY